MPLIVEDGSQVANANSYASLAQANARRTARAVNPDTDAWLIAEPDVQASSLISATDFLSGRYRLLWAGFRVSVTQSLDWPRYEVPQLDAPTAYSPFDTFYPNNAVPSEVVNATIDLALKVLNGTELDPDLGAQVTRETVGPITTVYEDGARQNTFFSAIDSMLQPLLYSGGANSIPLTRG